ncbi:serine/threonine-protein kinase M1 [Linderina macrospora]|uniref:Serine/threonine-protein kinase M1 n=1 Tax=Linderina macrospora TaxID=4868 RepID=A0ACC1JFE7_9FUNG|nr:serine/threonine-protein kinase M1 [Linderina macrospora]
MLDERSGGVIHVDFDCIFDKGLILPVPEKVPFRLTHNMVDAMGITGYEGTFRKTCEVTLRLLRDNHDALMSVLEPILHDLPFEPSSSLQPLGMPLVSATGTIYTRGQAKKVLATISKKLKGTLYSQTPFSIEGQVNELIRLATDLKTLFEMYVGWAAYM